MRVGCVAVLVASKFGVGSAGWTGQGISVLRSARARAMLEKKKKGFADDIVMLNSVLYAAGRYFFPCLSLSFFFTLLKVT